MKCSILWWISKAARSHSPVGQLSLFLSLMCTLFAASASAAPVVFVVTASQQFGTVDLATGDFQPIGNPTPDIMADLVWWHGSLLSLTASGDDVGSLAKIDPATGAVTDIGLTGLGFNAFSLAEFGGKLYLTDFSNNLYSVDPATGAATFLATTGMPPDPNIPFTFNRDGTFNLCDEGMYGIAGRLVANFDAFALDPTQTPPTRAHGFVSPRLYAVDPLTGATTVLANTDWQITSLVEANGKTYAFKGVLDGFNVNYGFPISHPELDTLDLNTGKTAKLANIDPDLILIVGAAPTR